MFSSLILLSSLALAESSAVYIAPFTALDPAADDIAAQIPSLLVKHLKTVGSIDGYGLKSMKPVHDMPADIYVQTCPTEEYIGCAFVIGEASEMVYSVVGTVTPLETGSAVKIHIIEISSAREALILDLQIAEGGEAAFVTAVGRSLVGVASGAIGAEEDLRGEEEVLDAYNEDEAFAVDAYTRESGGAEMVEERVDVELEQNIITEEDLKYMMQVEGSKEWDRLDMKPKEYMNYFNSGMSLARWNDLRSGRKGQLIARAGLGVERGPLNGYYYGRIAKAQTDFAVIDSYAWQTLEQGTGFDASASLSFGVLPSLDIGLEAGVATGGFVLDIHSFVLGQNSAEPPSKVYPKTSRYIGAQAIYVFRIMETVKPLIGVETTFWKASDMNFDFSEPYPRLDPANYLTIGGIFGGELSLNKNLDFFIHVPVGIAVVTNNAAIIEQQNGGILSVDAVEGDVARVKLPSSFSNLSTGIKLGIQIRIPVMKEKVSDYDLYE